MFKALDYNSLIDKTESIVRSIGIHSIVKTVHFMHKSHKDIPNCRPYLSKSVLTYTTASAFSIFALIKHTNMKRHESTKNSGLLSCYYV
jgi:hypothetical protein